MNKIPTAIEFFYKMNPDYSNIPAGFEIVMTEFAKLHVKPALEAAAKRTINIHHDCATLNQEANDFEEAVTEYIVNAYPLTNIK